MRKYTVSAVLALSLVLQGVFAFLTPGDGTALAGQTDWTPYGAEAWEAVCIDDGDLDLSGLFAVPSPMLRAGRDVWNMGTSYAYNDLGTRSSGAQRQSLYRIIASVCADFAADMERDVTPVQGYYAVSILPLADYGLNLTVNETVETYFMFRSDNPQYYWLSSKMVYSRSEGYVLRLYLTTYPEFQSGAVRSAIASELEPKLNEYVAAAQAAGSTRAAQVAAVYDKLTSEIKYNEYDDLGWIHTVLGAFGIQGHAGAVCEGYSKAIQLILNALGIPVLFVSGNFRSDGVGHAWNLVQMEDGQYYGLDATWDSINARGTWCYFLVGSDYFSRTHTPAVSTDTGTFFQYDLPVMSAEDYPGAAAENTPEQPDPGEEETQDPDDPAELIYTWPVVTSMEVSGISADCYTVAVTFEAPAGLKEVLMPTWTTAGGQDDLVWHIAQTEGDTAVYTVNVSDHGGESGEYMTHIYVRDVLGREVLAWTKVDVPGPSGDGSGEETPETPEPSGDGSGEESPEDSEPAGDGGSPEASEQAITSVWTSDVTPEGYTVNVTFTGEAGEVFFPTWTEAGGQDDLVWHQGAVSGQSASCRVTSAGHNRESGSYITHVYVWRPDGSFSLACINETVPAGGAASQEQVLDSGLEYSPVFQADAYLERYPDLRAAFGSDSRAAFRHFLQYGMKEGRIASPGFDVHVYRERYPDLQAAFGPDLQQYYIHYLQYGIAERRSGV